MAAFTERIISSSQGRVIAYDHGAHVAQWTLHGVPVVWVSRRSMYTADKAIRGGIPVCWPWFANGPSGEQSPSHGLVRTLPWRLTDHQADALAWSLSAADLPSPSRDLYPADFDSMVQVRISPDDLEISHTLVNTGSSALTYEIALHTYLHVGDVRDVVVLGLDGVDYYDKVLRTSARQEETLRISGEVDRIYGSPGPIQVHDPTLNRVLNIEAKGAGNVVLWNPGSVGAEEMSDFADEEWTRMVCVETANIGDRAVHVEPGARHTTAARISVQGLDARKDHKR